MKSRQTPDPISIDKWPDPAATWATLADDLRLRSDLRQRVAPCRRLLRETKALCLYHGTTLFIPDSHLTDNRLLQQLYLDLDTGIAWAFRMGMLVLALRDRAENLAEVNEQQGTKRSVPAMLTRARPFVRKFDREQSLEARWARWSLSKLSGGFEGAINRLIEEGHLVLNSTARSMLSRARRKAIRRAREEAHDASEGYFRFGDVYQELRRLTGSNDFDPAIQAARTAYLLNPGLKLGVDTSPVASDLPTRFLSFVAYGTATAQWPTDTDDIVSELDIPGLDVITQAGLDALTFPDIRRAQAFAKKIGYFRALKAVSAAPHTAECWSVLRDYTKRLKRYVKYMKREWPILDVVPLDEYFQMVSKRLKLANMESRAWRWRLLGMAMPIVLFAGGAALTMNALGINEAGALLRATEGVATAGALAGGLASKLISRRFSKKEKELRRTLSGTMRIPGTAQQEFPDR